MYPPRSRSRQSKKHSSKKRRRTVWAWFNVVLLLMITGLLAYSFMDNKEKESSAPPVAVTEPSPSPEASATAAAPVEVAPTAEATASPEPTPEATPEATALPTETAEAVITPVSTVKEAAATAEPQATTGNPGGLISGLPENSSGGTVKLNFAGDVIFAGKVAELLQKKGYDYSYSALDGMFKKDDLTVVNLETPITTGGVGAANKQFVFKGAPEALDALKSAGVDAVNLANNHTLDQGKRACWIP